MSDRPRAGGVLRLVGPTAVAEPDPFALPVSAHALPVPAVDSADLLASLPDDPARLVWPSQVWRDHAEACGHSLRRCPHVAEVVLPEWWVAQMARLTPIDADPARAVEVAMRRINGYKGGPAVTAQGAEFARAVARDALLAATQPVTDGWVKQTLACMGALSTWVHNEGEPLTVEHVLAKATWSRYLDSRHGTQSLDKFSRRNYRLRYDKIAATLLGSQRTPRQNKKVPVGQPGPLLPLTVQQETDVWVWSQGLRPVTVRQRIQGVIVSGLGVGARRRDFVMIRARHVTRDEHGVHVSLPETTTTNSRVMPPRTVTCTAGWEDRLWDLAQSMPPDAYLASPWRQTGEVMRQSVDATMRATMNDPAARPPVDFSNESLRNTWLLRHIEAGTPLPILMQQSSLATTASLEKLIPLATAVPAATAAAMMRAPGHGNLARGGV